MTKLGTGMLEGGIESALLGLTLGILVFVFLIIFATFVYYALAWMTLGKKLKYSRPWLAWIPFANISMMLQMGGFHWAWVFLVLLPIFGWIALYVLVLIATWRIYEQRKYPGWLSLLPLLSVVPLLGALAGIGSLIALGIVAWSDR